MNDQTNDQTSDQTLECRLDFSGSPQPLTVGDLGLLSCQGDFSKLDPKTAKTYDPDTKTTDYRLVILGIKESTAQNTTWVVTTYKPGQYQGLNVQLMFGTEVVAVSPLEWQVNSVLKPNTKPEPAPSLGPIDMAYPLWFWLAIAGTLIVCAALGFWWWRRGERRRRLYREMERHMSMLSAFSQFSKDMRSLTRERLTKKPQDDFQVGGLIDELEKVYRLYLLRELKIPALDFSSREILWEIKRRHPNVYDHFHVQLRRLFFEIEKAKRSTVKVGYKDCEQIVHFCRQLADKIQAARRMS